MIIYGTIQDFFVISLVPPNPRSSFLIPLQFTHPIRLVTDSWVDEGVLHPQHLAIFPRGAYSILFLADSFGTDAEIYLWTGRC
jgi:hypothetical protein